MNMKLLSLAQASRWERPSYCHQLPPPRPPSSPGTIPSVYLHLYLSFGPVVSSGLHLVLIRSSHSIKTKLHLAKRKSNTAIMSSSHSLLAVFFSHVDCYFSFLWLKVCWRDWYTSYRNANLSPFGENHHFDSKCVQFVSFVTCEQLFLVFLVSPSSSGSDLRFDHL